MDKYILSGGPGTGKTTALCELEKLGYAVVPESARSIIAEEINKPSGILPWTDLQTFQRLVFARQLRHENQALTDKHQKIFHDRSLVDGIAYAEVGNAAVPQEIYRSIEQANYKRVFYLEQLPCYAQDKERKEDSELAERIHQRLYQVYDRLGFDIVKIPSCGIEKRVEMILAETDQQKNREIERKYQVRHDLVRQTLKDYVLTTAVTDLEQNHLYDFLGIIRELGGVLRLRRIGDQNILTIKGPSRSKTMQNKTEYNFSVPVAVASVIDNLFPRSVSYSKLREKYHPIGDASCTICLDAIPQLGEFVEIEAATENQVLLWEKRLQIAKYAIKESYPQLVDSLKTEKN
ncbi:MAG: AAA family ATPase, partial [Nanoarchaeota archaeon]